MCMQFNVQCAVRVCGRGRRCTVDATRGHPRQMSAETATRRTRPTTAGRWAADAAPGGSAERPPRAVTKRGVRRVRCACRCRSVTVSVRSPHSSAEVRSFITTTSLSFCPMPLVVREHERA
jgi:hypothetical protein